MLCTCLLGQAEVSLAAKSQGSAVTCQHSSIVLRSFIYELVTIPKRAHPQHSERIALPSSHELLYYGDLQVSQTERQWTWQYAATGSAGTASWAADAGSNTQERNCPMLRLAIKAIMSVAIRSV